MGLFFENSHITSAIAHATGASARTGDWVSLEQYHKMAILVIIYQGNAATTAITVDKACTSAGGTESTGITLNNFWYMADVTAGTTADTWTKGTAAASITTSSTGSGTSYYYIEIDAEELPASGTNYKFIELNCGASNSGNIIHAVYIGLEPRYPQDLTPTMQS